MFRQSATLCLKALQNYICYYVTLDLAFCVLLASIMSSVNVPLTSVQTENTSTITIL